MPDRVESSLARLTKEFPDRVKVPADRRFVGFDNYKGVLSVPEVNLIVTAAPPGFRPIHLKAAIEAGKHVFMEKPVAVDPVGVRSVIAIVELAAQKKLAIVAGTQRRHQQPLPRDDEAHPGRPDRRDRRRAVLLEPGRSVGEGAQARA